MFINNIYAGTESISDNTAHNLKEEQIDNNSAANINNKINKDTRIGDIQKDIRADNVLSPNNANINNTKKVKTETPGNTTYTKTQGVDNDVVADDALAGNLSAWASFLPIALMFGVFYLFLIRPQEKRRKEQEDMIKGVQKGENIITAGGIYGTVTRVDDTTIDLEIAKDTQIRILKTAILEIPSRKITQA